MVSRRSSDLFSDPELFGAEYYSAFLTNQGADFARIMEGLEERFPEVPIGYLESAALTGIEAASLGGRFKKLGQNYRLNPDLIPTDPNLTRGFRYITTVACFDAAGYNPIFRTFMIDSPANLTKAELRDAAKDAFRTALGSDKYTLEQLQCSPDMVVFSDLQGAYKAG